MSAFGFDSLFDPICNKGSSFIFPLGFVNLVPLTEVGKLVLYMSSLDQTVGESILLLICRYDMSWCLGRPPFITGTGFAMV